MLVIEEIKDILSQEFCCYGYYNVTDELREMGNIINYKKVYRLMKEQNLLLGKVFSTSGKRQFVKHRKIEATPFKYLRMEKKLFGLLENPEITFSLLFLIFLLE